MLRDCNDIHEYSDGCDENNIMIKLFGSRHNYEYVITREKICGYKRTGDVFKSKVEYYDEYKCYVCGCRLYVNHDKGIKWYQNMGCRPVKKVVVDAVKYLSKEMKNSEIS
jgi:hypothetical protein